MSDQNKNASSSKLERNFIQNERVYAGCYSNWCPCTHLFRLSLPGWGKMILAVSVCPMFPRWGSSCRISVCSPVNCITCHDGLDFCILPWVMWDSRSSTGGCSSCVSLSSYFWAAENEEIMYKNDYNSFTVKGTLLIWVFRARGKVAATHLSVLTLRAGQAEAIVSFLGSQKQEDAAVHVWRHLRW